MEKMAAQRASQLASRKELEDSFQSGLKALSAKQYETAIHLLSRASELDPKQSAIWANLADANSGLAGTKSGTDRNSLYLKSIEYYGKAIELKPDEASFLNNYAICLGHLSRVEEARAALDKAIRINPEKANTYYLNLGAILHEAHQDRRGDRGLSEDPRDCARIRSRRNTTQRGSEGQPRVEIDCLPAQRRFCFHPEYLRGGREDSLPGSQGEGACQGPGHGCVGFEGDHPRRGQLCHRGVESVRIGLHAHDVSDERWAPAGV